MEEQQYYTVKTPWGHTYQICALSLEEAKKLIDQYEVNMLSFVHIYISSLTQHPEILYADGVFHNVKIGNFWG